MPTQQFDKVFAVNVNLFWTGPADVELLVITKSLRSGGTLFLFYEGPAPDASSRVIQAVTAALGAHGFDTEVETGALLCITGRLTD